MKINRKIRHVPQGKLIYDDVLVVGTSYREENVLAAWNLLNETERKFTKIAAVIYPEPDNKVDKHAMAVHINVSEKLGFLKSRSHEFHIGYLPRNMAYACSKREKEGEIVDAALNSFSYDPDEEYKFNIAIDVYSWK